MDIKANTFSTASRTLGVIALLCSFLSLFWLTLVLGGMAVILAVLSRGYNRNFDKTARAGMVAAVSALAVQIVMFIITIYGILYIPEIREEFISIFNEIYQQIYGIPFEDSGISFPDNMGTIL